jgi:hypothetical protein
MKIVNAWIIFCFLSITILPNKLYSQSTYDKCDFERYNSAKLSDDNETFRQFNSCLDSICSALNKKDQQKALKYFEMAISYKADVVFINEEYEGLKYYLNELKKEEKQVFSNNEISSIDIQDSSKSTSLEDLSDENNKQGTDIKRKYESEQNQKSDNDKIETKNVISTKEKNTNEISEPEQQKDANSLAKNNEYESEVVKTELNSNKSIIDFTNDSPKDVETSANDESDIGISFSDQELIELKIKGLQKIKQFEVYIKQISSKQTDAYSAKLIIEEALKLFDKPDDRYIQVSTISNSIKQSRKVKNYLERLNQLQYDDVRIEWAEINYASEFTAAPDGTYRAYVVFAQTFSGFKDGQPIYQDRTTKRQEIIVKKYEKVSSGESIENWDVFLGDVSVEHTE